MYQRKRRINHCLTGIIIAATILTALFAFYHAGDEPENPMEGRGANASRMYDGNYNGIPLSDYAAKTLENTSEIENDSAGDRDARAGESGGKKDPGTGSNQSGENLEKGLDQEGNLSHKRNKGEEQTSSHSSEKIYFTTSIIDGQTVPKYEYSFIITHLIEELTVENVSVYVNDLIWENFSGSVLLTEGSNTIKIVVTYRDDGEKEIVAWKSYRVIVDTKNLSITTTLYNQTVDNPFFTFTAYATMGENNADIQVMLNDKEVSGTKNKYSITLTQGKNNIVIRASYGEYLVIEKYEIILSVAQEYRIYTTLYNQTINTDTIDFKAMILNGTSKAKLSVIVNGNVINGDGAQYRAQLVIGSNTIRLKATDTGGVSLQQIYTIQYVPVATKETEPKLTYINVSDGMNINGNRFTLNIGAEDYEGKRIYYDGIEVSLNGKKIQYRWSSQYTSYLLNLMNGNNELEIRITDSAGRYKDYAYSLNCTYIDEKTIIGTATVSMDAKVLHIGVLMKPKKVDIYYGDNAADIFARAMEGSGYTYTYSGTIAEGFYLESVGRPGMLRGWKIDDALREEILEDGLQFHLIPETGEYVYDMDSLSQLDFCQGSGWTYSINGEYMEYGMSEYHPKDGDALLLRYTLAYGKDIGAYSSYSGTYGIKEQYENIY